MNAGPQLITPRLRLREWQPQDAAAMAAINRDPEVTRHLNRPTDERSVELFYDLMLDHWTRHGFGPWAVEAVGAEPAGFIGFAGVAHPGYLPALAARPELGWRLARGAWGAGLATEAATAARDHAFDVLGLAELISIIHPDNARSARVAEKLGMALEGQVHNPHLRRAVDVWQLSRPQ